MSIGARDEWLLCSSGRFSCVCVPCSTFCHPFLAFNDSHADIRRRECFLLRFTLFFGQSFFFFCCFLMLFCRSFASVRVCLSLLTSDTRSTYRHGVRSHSPRMCSEREDRRRVLHRVSSFCTFRCLEEVGRILDVLLSVDDVL